ncbi:GNAT family N-acetyltransferase [Thermodesulfobacteriota bacterium]
MKFRNSKSDDIESICDLHVDAFDDTEGPVIAELVRAILNTQMDKPVYSFVIEGKKRIIGHIVFSPVLIQGSEKIKAYILAPLAISTGHQKQGLGTRLISYSINELKEHGVEVLFVYGDPAYYSRSGFKTEKNVSAPYDLEYPEAWMTMELINGSLSNVHGTVKCMLPLMSGVYW